MCKLYCLNNVLHKFEGTFALSGIGYAFANEDPMNIQSVYCFNLSPKSMTKTIDEFTKSGTILIYL